jgi:hypothetical protein
MVQMRPETPAERGPADFPPRPQAGGKLAERGGFEPPVPVRTRHLSKVVHSATLPPLRWGAQ